jgi:hypothetical protein
MTVSNSSIGIPRGLAQSVPLAVKSQAIAPDRSPGQGELSWFWLLPMLLVAGLWWRLLMKISTRSEHRSPVAAAKLAPIDPVMPIVDTPVSADDETATLPPVTAKFTSPSAAIQFLQSIDHRQNAQMNIVIEAADDQWDEDRWLQESNRQTAVIGS